MANQNPQSQQSQGNSGGGSLTVKIIDTNSTKLVDVTPALTSTAELTTNPKTTGKYFVEEGTASNWMAAVWTTGSPAATSFEEVQKVDKIHIVVNGKKGEKVAIPVLATHAYKTWGAKINNKEELKAVIGEAEFAKLVEAQGEIDQVTSCNYYGAEKNMVVNVKVKPGGCSALYSWIPVTNPSTKMIICIVICLVVLLVIAGLAFFFVKRNKKVSAAESAVITKPAVPGSPTDVLQAVESQPGSLPESDTVEAPPGMYFESRRSDRPDKTEAELFPIKPNGETATGRSFAAMYWAGAVAVCAAYVTSKMVDRRVISSKRKADVDGFEMVLQ